ncbi:ORF27 [Betabaculovirus altermyunipunctae]|uniref:ORF27 n=1 Tax=Betabaculovirus altermyunipunctae TaxID=3051996 RepID=A0A1S5YE90_9BBAC|nr:ORF27 [Betabaculovirus altermyunipunctae]AQQ80294.1 ORF27 [Betabaculovirus altermyunipunctae]
MYSRDLCLLLVLRIMPNAGVVYEALPNKKCDTYFYTVYYRTFFAKTRTLRHQHTMRYTRNKHVVDLYTLFTSTISITRQLVLKI